MNNHPPSPGGILYIVATPIGNRGDITLRALDVLKSVDMVAAEDTRHTAGLLAHYGIQAPLVSCHEHNEAERADQLVRKLMAGKSVALVSNAGTPTVSDPGYRMVTRAVEQGIPVVPIPGVSAAMTALSASGLPSDTFSFIGFPPRKKGKRDSLLKELALRSETLIFYESPRRVLVLLDAIFEQMGDRQAVLGRELTKMHEEFLHGRISDIIARLKDRESIKGEVTLLVSGRNPDDDQTPESLDSVIKDLILKDDIPVSRLAGMLAKRYHLTKNEVYQKILEIKLDMAEDES